MSFFETATDTEYQQGSAEIGFIIDLQIAIERALDERGLTQSDLARLMNVSEPRVSKMLSDSGANLRARTIGRIGDALGLKPCLRFEVVSGEKCAISMSGWVRDDDKIVKEVTWGRALATNRNAWIQEMEPRSAGAKT